MSNVDQASARPISIVHACPSCGHTIAALRTDIPDPGLNRDFQSLLLSNNQPAQAVVDIARRQYEEAKDYFADIDAQTSRMQARTARLSEERDKIGQYLEQYKTVLHPSRRLPVEILARIFWLSAVGLNGVHPKLVSWHGNLCNLTKTIRVLSQVCRLWRSAALFPFLWSHICITLGPVSRDLARVTPQLSFLVLQIQRSLHCPLTIHISSYSDSSYVPNNPLLAILFSTSPRWQTLRVAMRYDELESLSPVRGSLQSLQTLHVNVSCFSPGLIVVGLRVTLPIDVFESAPALQNLILTGNVSNAHIHIKLPWSQIRRFSWDGNINAHNGTPINLKILSLMPNLRYCFIRGAPSAAELHPQIPLLSLEELIIMRTDRTLLPQMPITQFLDAIRVPSLQQFQMPSGIDQADLTSLVSFVSRRPSALHSINLQNLPFKSSEITHLLSCLPLSITFMVLGMANGVDAEVVRAFHYSPASHSLPLLPKLEYLSFVCENKCGDDILIDMLESRYRPSPEALRLGLFRLERLSVPENLSGYDTLVANPRIAQLRSEGLKIEGFVFPPSPAVWMMC